MNLVDTLICQLDAGLRTVFGTTAAARMTPYAVPNAAPQMATPQVATPPITPSDNPISHQATLTANAVQQSIRLMRVNHVGEVCAQALYQGQLLVARDAATRGVLEHAAQEERDHLAWCAERIQSLGGRTSVLSPVFYAGAWALGVASGLAGDKWSMGFLVETERQVEAHLTTHLDKLPIDDADSRAIVLQMREDEIAHGSSGEANGAMPLPPPMQTAMRLSSKIMTSTTYWV